MFKFDYIPPEQLGGFVDFALGRAQFVITGWTDKDKQGMKMFSQGGDAKVNIILHVRDSAMQEGNYFDSLTSKTQWKLKSLLDSIGMPELYTAAGHINLDLIVGKSGNCEFKEPTGDYKKPNVVYLTQAQMALPVRSAPATIATPATHRPSSGAVMHTADHYTPPPRTQSMQSNQAALDEYDNQIPF